MLLLLHLLKLFKVEIQREWCFLECSGSDITIANVWDMMLSVMLGKSQRGGPEKSLARDEINYKIML